MKYFLKQTQIFIFQPAPLTETGFIYSIIQILTWSLSLPRNSIFSATNFKECRKIKVFIWSIPKMLDFIGFFDNLCAENGLIWSYCVQSGHTDCSNHNNFLSIFPERTTVSCTFVIIFVITIHTIF